MEYAVGRMHDKKGEQQMKHVNEYDQLIAKRMFADGYSEEEVTRYLTSKYGHVNPRFVRRLRMEMENGNGRAH